MRMLEGYWPLGLEIHGCDLTYPKLAAELRRSLSGTQAKVSRPLWRSLANE